MVLDGPVSRGSGNMYPCLPLRKRLNLCSQLAILRIAAADNCGSVDCLTARGTDLPRALLELVFGPGLTLFLSVQVGQSPF